MPHPEESAGVDDRKQNLVILLYNNVFVFADLFLLFPHHLLLHSLPSAISSLNFKGRGHYFPSSGYT
jgi:hypothetical protein